MIVATLEVDKDPRPTESRVEWTAEGENVLVRIGAVDPRVLRRTVTSVFEMLILSLRTLNAFDTTTTTTTTLADD